MRSFLIFFIALAISPSAAHSADFQLTSAAFEDNAVIPNIYTCEGRDINPPLSFKNIPSGAKSLALTVSDPDAPMGSWSHWVIYNIPPDTSEISENSAPGTQGWNDFGKEDYGGPCPPAGKLHHYIFEAYALDSSLTMPTHATIHEVKKDIQGHVIAQAKLTGTYSR